MEIGISESRREAARKTVRDFFSSEDSLYDSLEDVIRLDAYGIRDELWADIACNIDGGRLTITVAAGIGYAHYDGFTIDLFPEEIEALTLALEDMGAIRRIDEDR